MIKKIIQWLMEDFIETLTDKIPESIKSFIKPFADEFKDFMKDYKKNNPKSYRKFCMTIIIVVTIALMGNWVSTSVIDKVKEINEIRIQNLTIKKMEMELQHQQTPQKSNTSGNLISPVADIQSLQRKRVFELIESINSDP